MALASSLSACGEASEIPTTPDLTQLQDDYNHPTAVLDPASADSALADMPSLADIAAGIRAAGFASTGVDQASASSRRSSDSALNIQGSIRVNLRCPGDGERAEFDAATNGTVSIVIGVENSRIKRGIGGTAERCVLRGELGDLPIRIEVDGPFAFDLGRDQSVRDKWAGRLLMRIDGEIHIGGLELRNLSGRFTRDLFEYLFVMPDDTWIVAQLTVEGITIRDSQLTWLCPAGQSCAPM